ncbi:MAG: hypothetical protein RLZZ612_1374 [Pseudomonadota bacterium]
MNTLVDPSFKQIQFYLTASYPCSYLPDRKARSQVASPSYKVDTQGYAYLMTLGFRRSGLFTYRPFCDNCQSCIPIRIVTHEFESNRSQRRAKVKHQNLHAELMRPAFQQAHYELFMRYQSERHPDGAMNQDSIEQYTQFLIKSQVDSYLIEFTDPADQSIKMVMLVDLVENGLSAVYTFYEPEPRNSYGTYAVLWAIDFAKQRQLSYLYLGYWIKESQKMNYKNRFTPNEVYRGGAWKTYSEAKSE